MDRINELYREKDRLEAAMLALLFLPLPGIALGLALQIRIVDRKIRKELSKLNVGTVYVVLPEDKNGDNKS